MTDDQSWNARMAAELADAALALKAVKRASGCWCESGKDLPVELHSDGCRRVVAWLKRRAKWLKREGKEYAGA